MLVRLINERTIEKFKGVYEADGIVYTNNDAVARARQDGWKDLVIDELPEYDSDTHILSPYYYIKDEAIHKG